MTPRAPLGLVRPLAATIAPPGSPVPAARRRGEKLSWRHALAAAASAPTNRLEVHHHWPLTVTLLFGVARAEPAAPPSRAAPHAVPTPFARPTPAGTLMVWERRTPRDTARPARSGDETPSSRPALASPSALALAPRAAVVDAIPVFARTLHRLVEQRWRHTRTVRHLPSDLREGIAPVSPAGRAAAAIHYARHSDTAALSVPAARRRAAHFSAPMRPAERPLFASDPLVHRSLRRIPVTPLVARGRWTAAAPIGMRAPSPVRAAAEIVQSRGVRPARARVAEQVWHGGRSGADATALAQPFAPVFSAPGAAAPAIAFAPASPAASPAPAAPDVNRLVDEVMRRIERQTRQDRLRRGL
ncbi:hypothetical protein [Sphingomonas bacterium]|uniref:hypothetical protein n=1 Tax=Sphingomonas bacterium TaxID=1895847 RepID=UPI002609B5FD|nr:hypothetical protein [Sphingomonas bacterium]MDB5678525.1 hypothetical protein [Sphingomonas bacterium]